MRTLLYYRMAIAYFCLFSLNALATSAIAALAGKNWAELTGTARFLIVTAIVANWTGTVLAFLNKQLSKIENETKPPTP